MYMYKYYLEYIGLCVYFVMKTIYFVEVASI